MKTIDRIILFIFLQILIGCSSDTPINSKTASQNDSSKIASKDTIATISKDEIPKDSVILTESQNEADLPINDYRTEELKPIRENYQKINSIKEWSSVDKRKLVMTPENGLAEYYFIDGTLQKIIARYPDKNEISEFYLLNGKLSLVIFKSILTEDNYEELITDKNYFQDSKLLSKIHSQDCGAPFSDEYIIEEQKRILDIYNKIKNRINK